jgi:hypothetical protein
MGAAKKHFMLMGDFNYRYDCWPVKLTVHGVSSAALDFAATLDDNFCTQHVNFSTRGNAILDLLITDEPAMVSELSSMGLFPGSDHNAMIWKLQISVVAKQAEVQDVLDYAAADVRAMQVELGQINWQFLSGGLSVETGWLTFKSILEDIESKYIPKRRRPGARVKPIWMTNAALRAVRHRKRVFHKYRSSDHPAYIKAARAAHHLTRQARRNFETKLAEQIKVDKKSFFSYARSQAKSMVSIGSLVMDDHTLITDNASKTDF